MESAGGSASAEHLCVLVHGLWGNPKHMASIAKALRAEYSADKLHILMAARNSGSFTYDGIELGGERVCLEIEEELAAIQSRGGRATRLSVVGYSLGGLVARYAVGLLHARGVLDGLECMNFAAFASPFLGVRAPLRGWYDHVWNTVGARTLSESGRQLFTVDDFRATGRPLLALLADPGSVFMRALARFRRRTLYANVVNDRSAVYYTTGISKTDPYADLDRVRPNYLAGYADVILDPAHPFTPAHSKEEEGEEEAGEDPQQQQQHRPPPAGGVVGAGAAWVKSVPFMLALALFVPIGLTAFLLNSGVQTVRSSKRIRLHERGQAGIDVSNYRLPLLAEMRSAVEDAYENLNSSQGPAYLRAAAADDDDDDDSSADDDGSDDAANARILRLERRQSLPHQPTLALAPCQFEMINALDNLGWRKYPVWIHKVRHSHAAIIVRSEKKGFAEGHVVLRHWVKDEFLF